MTFDTVCRHLEIRFYLDFLVQRSNKVKDKRAQQNIKIKMFHARNN